MNEVNARRAWLVHGWVTVFGGRGGGGIPSRYVTSQLGAVVQSLNRVPASAGVKAGMSPLSGGR